MQAVAWLIGADHLGAPAGEGYAPFPMALLDL
jgi:hypothetical protein